MRSPREVESLVDIPSDGTLKTTFKEKGLTDFWAFGLGGLSVCFMGDMVIGLKKLEKH